jgi:hypothetical protein
MKKKVYPSRRILLVLLTLLSANTLPLTAAELRQKTLAAWDKYVQITEDEISHEIRAEDAFLAAAFLDGEKFDRCRKLVQAGEICVLDMRESNTREQLEVPDGRIHHWLGTTLIPGARLEDVIEWIQDYDRHQKFYDDVEESRLIRREGNFFEIFLRLKRKKVITVHYNTNHDVQYFPQGEGRLYSFSRATRIREIDNPGSANETEKPEGQDNGFLWRLNSYWRYQETPEGVIVECESLSLSRSVPALLFMIEGIVDSTAREALEYTLGNLRDGFLSDHPNMASN